MYVCTCVCMYVRMNVCMHMDIHTCTVHMFVFYMYMLLRCLYRYKPYIRVCTYQRCTHMICVSIGTHIICVYMYMSTQMDFQQKSKKHMEIFGFSAEIRLLYMSTHMSTSISAHRYSKPSIRISTQNNGPHTYDFGILAKILGTLEVVQVHAQAFN